MMRQLEPEDHEELQYEAEGPYSSINDLGMKFTHYYALFVCEASRFEEYLTFHLCSMQSDLNALRSVC